MVLSRLLLAGAAVTASGLLWIEHEHRIVLATPAAAEAAPPVVSACPDNDSEPFNADCIAFIEGGAFPAINVHAEATARGADPASRGEAHPAACPASNENAPYSAGCIKFLSGWFWQANSQD